MEVGQVSFGVRFEENSIESALSDLKNRFSKIDNITISPQTDERALVGLNRHLDIKKRHLQEVVDFYDRNPLIPTIKEIPKTEIDQFVKKAEMYLTIQPKVEYSKTQNEPQTIRQESSQTFKVKEELDPLKAIAGGAFEQIGATFSKRFTGSFIKSVEDKIGITLKDAGKYTGQFATHVWDSKFNSNYHQAKQQNVEETARGIPLNLRTKVPEYMSPGKAGAYTADLAMQLYNQHTQAPSPTNSNNTSQKQAAEKLHRETQNINARVAQVFSKNIDSSVSAIKAEISRDTGNIASTKTQFDNIKKGFAEAYKQMNQHLEKGNIELARGHAKMIVDMSARAKAEIDKIKSNLAANGTPTGFGKEVSTLAGSAKGTIERSYSKGAQRVLNKIESGNFKVSADSNMVNETAEIGVQTVQGLAKGLGQTSLAGRKSAEIAFVILNSMRKELGIQSPSKKGDWIGQMFVQGIVQGIQKGGKSVDNVAEMISKKIVSAFTAKMPDLPTETGIIPDPDLPEEEFQKQMKRRNRVKHAGLRGNTREQRKFIKGGFIPQNADEWNEFNPGSREYFDLQFNRFGKRFQKDVGGRFASQAGEHGEKVSSNAISREIAGAVAAAGVLAAPAQMGMAALSPLAIPLAPSAITGMMVTNLLSPIFEQIGKTITRVDPILNKYTAISGSKEGGEKELNYVRGVTSQYAVGMEGASDQYASLSAAAKGTKLEGEGVKELFEGIAASSRAMNLGTYDSTLVFNAYTQILSKGKLSMEELRQQLGEKFPQAMQVFAEAMGLSVPEMQAMISKGAVLSEDILPKVATVLKTKFADAAKGAASSFTGSIARLDNAKFDLGAKLVQGFSGMFSAVNNAMAGVLQTIADNWKQIQTVLTTLLIGLGAQVAVALEMIFSSPQISKVTGVFQNFLSSAFSKSIYALTPFVAGMFVDLFDDAVGSKRNIIQNMSQGIGNMFVGIFGQIDHLSRVMKDTSLFSPKFETPGDGKGIFGGLIDQLDKINLLGVSIGQVARDFSDFFKGIAGGTGEFVALIVMFEQLAVLGAHFTAPTFKKIGMAAMDMAKGLFQAVSSFENVTLSFNNFIAVTLQQSSKLFGQLAARLAFFSAEAAVAVGVMMLAQSDFADPLATEMNKSSKKIIDDVGGIKKSLDELKSVGVETATGISKAFNEMDLQKAIPSKGIELNLKKVFGLEDESKSYKTDDLIKDLNRKPKDDDNLLLKFIRLFPQDSEADGTNKAAREMKAKAEKVGVGKFFSGEGMTTMGQDQLYNKAFDLQEFNTQLTKQLRSQNLTPDTVGNFATGQIGSQIDKVKQYDRVLEQLGSKRVKAALIDTTDSKKEVRQIDRDIKKVLADRKQLQKPLGQAFDFLKDAQSQIDEKMKSVQKSDLPFEGKQALLAPLEEQKKSIDQTIEYIKNSGLAKVAAPLEEIWSNVVSKLRDADSLFEKLTNRQKIEDLGKQTEIYSKNLSPDATKTSIDVANLEGLGNTEKALEAVLSARKKALERILAISDIDSNDERKKEVVELKKNIESDSLNLAQTKQQIAQAQNEMFNRLKEQGEKVEEYFDSIDNTAKEKALDLKKLQNNIKADGKQSKIRDILSDGFDTAISAFLESYNTIIDKQTEIANKKLEAEGSILKSKKDLETQINQGDTLLKSLATDGIEIKLDTSALRNDINIEVLNRKFGEGVDSVGNLKDKLGETENAVDRNTQSAAELYAQLAKIPEQLDVTKQKLEGNNTAVKNWNDSLTGSLGILGDINNGLTGMGATIVKNTLKATELMGVLATPTNLGEAAIQNAPKAGEILTKIGTTDPQKNPNVFGMLGNLMQGKGVYGDRFKNPIITAPYQAVESVSGRKIKSGDSSSEIEIHHPSRGVNGREVGSNRDYERINGRLEEVIRSQAGLLIKKDIVLSRNGRTDIDAPAPASGRVSKAGGTYGQVDIVNEAGQLVGQVLHMVNIKVKEGDYVQYGQALGTQGGKGPKGDNTYGTHYHGAMTKEGWSNFSRDLNDGGFDVNTVNNCSLCGATNHNQKQHEQLGNNSFTQAIKKGGLSNGFIGTNAKTPRISSTETGEASFYREPKYDKYNTDPRTRNGEWYNENADTAAIDSKRMDKLNTIAKVTNTKTGQARFVRITDTGVFGSKKFNNRIMDLSKGAAERIGITAQQGTGSIKTEFLEGKVPTGKAGEALVAQLNAQLQKGGVSVPDNSANQTPVGTTKSNSTVKKSGVTKGKREDRFPMKRSSDSKEKPGLTTPVPLPDILNPDISTSDLRAKVEQSQDQARDTDATEQERIKKQTDMDNKRLAADALREKNKAIKTLNDYSRDLGVEFKSSQRTVQDKEFESIPFPTIEQKKTKEIRDVRRTSEDNRTDILKKIRDVQKPIEQSKKMLDQVDLPSDMRTSAQKNLTQMMNVEEKYKKLLNKNNELEIKQMDAIEARYKREADLKSQKEKMEDRQQELTNLQKTIDKLEQLKNINPYDKRVRELPKLKEEAGLLENTLQYQQNLIDLEEADHNELNNDSYKKRLDLLKDQVETRRDAIKLTRVQEDREQALADMKRHREQDSRFLGLDNQLKKSLTRQPDTQYEVAESEAKNTLQNTYMDIEERKYENPIDALRERSKNAQIYLQQRDQAGLERDTSKVQFQQDDYDFFKQPGYDAENKRAEKLRANGREFRGNEISRQVGAAQEEFRYKQQLLQLENQLADRRSKGVIDSQEEIDNLKQSMEDLHNINLADLDDQFKTFGRTIDDVTKQAIGGLGNSIADLVVDGGDLGETLDGIFKNILKSFISTGINTGINSLTSNLFGGQGGGGIGSMFSSLFGGGKSNGGGGIGSLFGSSGLGSIFGGLGSIFGLKRGGMVPGYNTGGDIRQSDSPIGAALREEGHNSILATLTPNERVLTVDEAKVYNSLYPNGILNRMKPPGFSDGGMVESNSISQTIAKSSSINVGVTANVEDSGGSMKEKQLVNLIRTVVTSELNRQKAPGGILSN